MSFTSVPELKTKSPQKLDTNTFVVSLSDAEAQVIEKKAKKAGIRIDEYIRNAALGFPMS